jgi:pyrroline-5-carboxylate reductase
MPNTPALVGKGAAAFSGGENATEADLAFASDVFNAAGIGLQVPEKLLDAVTGLSGSGPAYVFEFIQALADGGVAEGLPRDTALQLAAQTVLGAAAMVLETGVHPAVLKDQVTSPGGTTIRGLEKLAERGFAGTVLQAVRSASARSAELGKK